MAEPNNQPSDLDAFANDFFGEEAKNTATQIRNNAQSSVAVNPDQEASYQHLARFVGAPVSAVRAQPELVKQRAAAQGIDADGIAQDHPVTAKALTNPNFFKLTSDDIDSLRALETTVKPGLLSDLSTGAKSTGLKILGAWDKAAVALDSLMPEGTPGKMTPEEKAYYLNRGQSLQGEGLRNPPQRWTGQVAAGLTYAPFLAAAPLVAGGTEGTARTQELEEQGVDPTIAAEAGMVEGGLQGLVQLLPLGKFATGLGLKPFVKSGVTTLGKAGAAGAAQSVGSDTAATLLLKSGGYDKLAEQYAPSAEKALDSALFMMGLHGGMQAGHSAFHVAAGRASAKVAQVEQAQQGAETIQQINDTATASKLRERDPEAFKQFMEEATKDGPVENLYLDPKTLNQAGIDPVELIDAVPGIAEQAKAAIEGGSDIKIPTSEFATHLAGTDLGQKLVEHLKTDPNGMSRAEADEFHQNQAESFKAEVEGVLREKEGDDAFKQSMQVVHDDVLAQLKGANRFTDDVNKPYATLMANFYAVQAARLGMTPEEMYRKHPVAIQADYPAPPGQVLHVEQDGNGWAVKDKDGTNITTVSDKAEAERIAAQGTTGGVEQRTEFETLDTVRPQAHAENEQPFETLDTVTPEGQKVEELNQSQQAPSFYSALEKSLTDLPQGKGSPEQWAGIVKNLTTKGVKQEEIEWSGVQDWLKQQKGSVTKEAVLDYLKAHQVQVEEAVKGGVGARPDDDETYSVVENEDGNGYDILNRNTGGYYARGYDTEEEAAAGIPQTNAGRAADTKFEKYTLPGGENYRELLITMPKAEGDNYKSSHYDEPNILAHLRFNERTDADGKRVMFIEEVQSDWHQQGREKGYKQNIDPAALQRELAEVRKIQGEHEIGTDRYEQAVKREGELIAQLETRDKSEAAVPDAPFKTSWPELAFKRALMWAVEHGFDRVAWTTGEQQAERYDLSKQVDRIIAAKEGDKFHVFARDNAGKNHDMGVLTPDELPNAVGKDLAKKIAAQEKESNTYEGVDLKVGGEGMKAFYDKMLPSMVNKLVKKWGGKVGASKLRAAVEGRLYKEVRDNGYDPDTVDIQQILTDNGGRLPSWLSESDADIIERGELSDYVSPGNYRVHSLDITPAMRQSIEGGLPLFQGEGTKRGSFNPETSTITLLKAADLSTFLHESGHFFLETMNKLALDPKAPEEIKADMTTTLKWLGVKDLTEWNSRDLEAKREAHEQFARGFEAYLFEGKSPSLEMQGVFQRFRAWLLNVYRSMRSLNVELNPDIRGVFDRMLATSDQIKQAEVARNYTPLFKTPEEAGMTPEEFKAYHDQGVQASQDAITNLEARSLRDMQWASGARGRELKRLQRDAASKRKAMRAEVSDEVMAEPVNQARTFLRRGEHNGEKVEGAHRLNIADLKEMYGEGPDAPWRKLESKFGQYGVLGKDGLHPDIAAEMFGFHNGKELVDALLTSEKPKDKINALTDQRMLERYGDLNSPEAMARAADQAIHNEARTRFVATELNALQKAIGKPKILATAAKQYAEATIARLKVRDVKPSQYTAAEVRAARNAEKARAKGDLKEAAAEKQKQLINNHATRAAYKAAEDIEKGLRYFRKFDKKSVRENIQLEYRDQIDALLDRFDLRKSQSLSAVDAKKESLQNFVERMSSQGYEPHIPEDFLNEMNRAHYKDMSVEAFRGLVDSVKSIERLGRAEQRMLDLTEMRAVNDLAAEAKNTMAQLPQRDPETNRGLSRMEAQWLKAKQAGRSGVAALLKMEQMFDWLDNRNPNGVLNRTVFRRIADAGSKEHDMMAKVKAGMEAMANVEDVTKDMQKKYTGVGSMIDQQTGRPQEFTKKEMLMLAGNYGNESNTAKLMKGENWKDVDVKAFLDANMSKADWDYVAALAKTLESLYPEKLAMSRRLGNTNPEKIAPRPFDTPHGRYEGWYWPLVYDPARSQDVAERGARKADAMFENIYTRANTDTGRMNTRNANYAKPLLLDLDAIPRVIADEIHDIAFREAILDSDKLLSHPEVRKSIISALSQEHYDQLRPWLQAIANDGKLDDSGMRALKFFNSVAKGARTRATIVGLGFRLSTMFVHGGSAAMESMAELGPKWFGAGLREFSNPARWAEQRDFVFERSGEMRNRMNEVDRDIREQLREIDQHMLDPATGAVVKATDAMKAHAYTGIAMLDMASALPTWMGAYLKAMTPEEKGGHGMSEADAVYFADKTVRNAHGGTGIKDFAAVQRGPEFFKLFSMFYTFWNHNINRIMDTARMAKALPETYRSGDMGKFRGDLGMVVMRSLIYTFGVQAMHALLHPPQQDDDKSWAKWAAQELGLALTSGIPIARDLAAHFIGGKDYQVTPAAGMVNAVGASGQDIWNASFGDKPVSEKWLRHTIETTGYVFGLPTGQAAATTQFLWDVERGEQNPESLADWWSGVVHGKIQH